MDIDGSGAVNISNDAGDDSGARWSPEGTQLAFESNRSGESRLWLASADGTGAAPLLGEVSAAAGALDADPTWSPDGTQIAFISDRDGNAEVYVYTVADGTIVRITDDPGFDFSLDWR
ncbi:unnamed protein product [Phaeothamnion confervicola]